MRNKMKLSYTQPATIWEETLPIGNGSLGGMIWGTIQQEKIGLNEESLWSGYPQEKNNPDAQVALDEVRQLIFAQKYADADELIRERMLGEYGESFLPLGNLLLNFDHSGPISDYNRELDIERAMAKVTYQSGGQAYTREYFSSYPLQGMVIRLSGLELSVSIGFESELHHQIEVKADKININGQCPEHVDPQYVSDSQQPIIQGTKGQRFNGEISLLQTNGQVETAKNQLKITEASEIVLLVSCVRKPTLAAKFSYERVKEEHIIDYQKIYSKVDIYLGEQLNLSTDKRLNLLKKNKPDSGLYGLYFQYGRYLLIASSRVGSLPPTLQGIWNWEIRAPWSSNWTININLQMNYWLAEVCNLEECLPPYFDFLKKVVSQGKITASTNYGCRGFVAHHNLDYWLNANPVGIVHGEKVGRPSSTFWSMWPMGGAWLCQELFRFYEYHSDEAFLRETVYPILREGALFLVDWLVEHEGQFVIAPSSSPENQFVIEGQGVFGMTQSASMDIQLIREVFANYRQTVQVLDLPEDDLLSDIKNRLAKLPTLKIGSQGQLLEWQQEYVENEPGHRHLSHLYGLFPGEGFDGEEQLIEGARRSLEMRLVNDSGHTGWSCAWIINLYAILGDGEKAYRYLNQLLTKSTLDNLWDTHPPFQIDGNFGGTAGIANMLVHERNGKLNLLPALPKEFKDGYVKGLRLKNKRTIDIYWENNQLTGYEIHIDR